MSSLLPRRIEVKSFLVTSMLSVSILADNSLSSWLILSELEALLEFLEFDFLKLKSFLPGLLYIQPNDHPYRI